MTKKEAIGWLKYAVPIRAVTSDEFSDFTTAVNMAIDALNPRKGKWIGYNADDKDWQRDDGSPIFMNCSECHEAVINNGSAHWNFCPNCGADMRGDNNDS